MKCLYRVCCIPLFVLVLLACTRAPSDPSADVGIGVGRSSPEAAVDGFLEDLNFALRDPSLNNFETQRIWAERLAGYFTPAERIDQRLAFIDMLATFADTSRYPIVGVRATLEITYSRLEILSRDDDTALVGVVEGAFLVRWLDDQGEVVRERTGSLTEVIGLASGGLPVVRMDRLWFLTDQ